MPISHVHQNAVSLLDLHERLVGLWHSDGTPPHAIDHALDEVISAARAADADFRNLASFMDGSSYVDLFARVYPSLQYEKIWEHHLNLVSPHLTSKDMRTLRNRARRNLGAAGRRLWRPTPPFLDERPLSTYCNLLGGCARTGSRRAVKKHAKKQIYRIKVLIVALSASSVPLKNDSFARSLSLSAGNSVVRKKWKA